MQYLAFHAVLTKGQGVKGTWSLSNEANFKRWKSSWHGDVANSLSLWDFCGPVEAFSLVFFVDLHLSCISHIRNISQNNEHTMNSGSLISSIDRAETDVILMLTDFQIWTPLLGPQHVDNNLIQAPRVQAFPLAVESGPRTCLHIVNFYQSKKKLA